MNDSAPLIHPTAVIDPSARLADDVRVGAFCLIGADVEIGAGTVVGPHCSIHGPTRIGRDNRFIGHAAIGGEPQDKKYAGERTELVIGDRNVVREFVTVNRGTGGGGGIVQGPDKSRPPIRRALLAHGRVGGGMGPPSAAQQLAAVAVAQFDRAGLGGAVHARYD